MIPTIIVVTAIILTYISTLGFRDRIVFGIRVTDALRFVQLAALPVFITLLILSESNIYLRGYWAPKIIFWVWFLTAMLLHAFGNKKEFYAIEKIIYKIMFFLPLAFIPLLLIPFIGPALILRFHESFIGDGSMILYSSNKVRIEQSYIIFMSPAPPIDIYTKSGLFSYKDTTLDIQFNAKLDSLKVKEIAPDSIKIVYFQNPQYSHGEPVEEFSIRLNKH